MTVHLRDETARGYALCGVGYPWPSSIAFADAEREATCRACLAKANDVTPTH